MPNSAEDAALKGLQSHDAKKLFDKIDELRTIGVGGLVELPQLIVCGDQSSGKSSVLEAISRVRFPTKSIACTRFATEVILRRCPESKFKVSIDPGESRTNAEEIERLRKFSLSSCPFEHEETVFEDLVRKAEEWMGIDSSDQMPTTGFSDDVLKVEISGPEKPELTLVDLPGLYSAKNRSSGQSIEGIEFVQNITKRYMKNPRSIILTVLTAKSNYILQDILDRAEDVDPTFERVLAVVTSLDRLDAGSDEEDEWLSFIKNEKQPKLKLGWHVLRNRGHSERDISDNERDETERKFFNEGKWSTLSRSIVGVESLRHRLSIILFNHVRRNFPGLIRDIQEKIASHEHSLAKLGAPRSTLQEQRSFLVNISSNFSHIVDHGLNGTYRHDFFEKDRHTDADRPVNLRAIIRDLNEYFVHAITMRGKYRNIIYEEKQPIPFVDTGKPGFGPYMNCWTPGEVKILDLLDETREQARTKRGLELPGNSNPLLVGELFRQQSSRWGDFARLHIETAYKAVAQFVSSVLGYLTDEDTFRAIFSGIIAPGLTKLRTSVFEKLDELTAHPKYGHPLPVRQLFLQQIQRSRATRYNQMITDQLRRIETQEPDSFTKGDIEVATFHMSGRSDEFAVIDTIDQAEAYYETALSTFVDNVAILAIENCLLMPLETIFTSLDVTNMDSKLIKSLAAEPAHVQSDRQIYHNQLEKLRAGLRTLDILNTDRPSLSTPAVAISRAPSPFENLNEEL